MRRRSLLQALGPLVIVAAGVTAFAWLRSLRAPPDASPPEDIVPPVQTVAIEPARESFELQLPGTVVPRRVVALSAEVRGRVVRRTGDCRPGQAVSQGTLLVQLDTSAHQAAVKQIDSQLEQTTIDSQLLKTESQGLETLIRLATEDLQLASRDLERMDSLVKQKSATPADRDRVRRAVISSDSTLRSLETRRSEIPLRRARLAARRQELLASRDLSLQDLERCRITAPLDGLITESHIEVGDAVQAGDLLFRIEESAAVEVEVAVGQDELNWIRETAGNQEATLELPELPASITSIIGGTRHTWTGRLVRLAGRGVDPRTRTIACRVAVSRQGVPATPPAPTAPAHLVRGGRVTVAITISPGEKLVEVPRAAVRPNGQAWSVEAGQLVVHELSIARVLAASVLLRQGTTRLAPGSRVVTSPLSIAYDGMPVRERAPIDVVDEDTVP